MSDAMEWPKKAREWAEASGIDIDDPGFVDRLKYSHPLPWDVKPAVTRARCGNCGAPASAGPCSFCGGVR